MNAAFVLSTVNLVKIEHNIRYTFIVALSEPYFNTLANNHYQLSAHFMIFKVMFVQLIFSVKCRAAVQALVAG